MTASRLCWFATSMLLVPLVLAALASNDDLEGWSYRPLARPAVPEVTDEAWITGPVDAFLLARLEARGLAPAPPASRVAWLRRVTYDLLGLPPVPEEVEAFLADESPDAHERVVERLLASPQYGVQWGRHWLDLVRYAETNGYERDDDKPLIWRYRDYVIDAFNADKPYDQFVREQLAGDELDAPTPESLVATGFTRLMIWDDEPPLGPLQARYDVLDDIVRTTSEGFLGMTLGCARCHDHKGDPIGQEDYYSFMAFFQGLTDYRTEGTLVEIMTPEERAVHEASVALHEEELARVTGELVALEQEFLRREARGTARADVSNAIQERGAEVLSEEELARYEELRVRRTLLDRGPDVKPRMATPPSKPARAPHPCTSTSAATRA